MNIIIYYILEILQTRIVTKYKNDFSYSGHLSSLCSLKILHNAISHSCRFESFILYDRLEEKKSMRLTIRCEERCYGLREIDVKFHGKNLQ